MGPPERGVLLLEAGGYTYGVLADGGAGRGPLGHVDSYDDVEACLAGDPARRRRAGGGGSDR